MMPPLHLYSMNISDLFLSATPLMRGEKAWTLQEFNIPAQDGTGWRRHQRIVVNRHDRLVEYERDLGLADSFQAEQFAIPSFWVHTVAELMDMADQERWGNDYWAKRTHELAAEDKETFLAEFADQLGSAYRWWKKQSTLGPYVRIQNS